MTIFFFCYVNESREIVRGTKFGFLGVRGCFLVFIVFKDSV